MIINGPYVTADVPVTAWKNGRGTTRTLASFPADAGLDNFAWRISLAQINEGAEFSTFPGVDRTILLFAGNGVMLHKDDGIDHPLTRPFEPLVFRGEDHVTATLVDGPTSDLNLMVRRDIADGRLACLQQEQRHNSDCDDVVLLCAAGSLRIEFHADQSIMLNAGDYIHLHSVRAPVMMLPQSEKTVYILVSIFLFANRE